MKILICIILIFVSNGLTQKPSLGCNQELGDVTLGDFKQVEIIIDDPFAGPVERNFLIRIPRGFDNTVALPLVFGAHGFGGSNSAMVYGDFAKLAKQRDDFILVYPDGMHDTIDDSKGGSWNVSKTVGPLGPMCDLPSRSKPVHCHESCPNCDPNNSCDWTTCTDDVKFIEVIQNVITDQWCVDLEQMHFYGFSNGGMFTWQVASTGLNGLGFATFYSISGTQPYGFGSPPEEINFSIFDMHGLLDQLVPSNAAISDGPGPNGGIIAKSSRFIFEEKQVFLEDWAQAMNCEMEESYETQYDGVNGFQCYKRSCGIHDIVRCEGDWAHQIPDVGIKTGPADVVFEFMLSHPRK